MGASGRGDGVPCAQRGLRPAPCGLTCLTCLTWLPTLRSETGSPAPRVWLARFLATKPELPSHLPGRGSGVRHRDSRDIEALVNRWAPGCTPPWRSPGAPGRCAARQEPGRSPSPGGGGAAAGGRRNAGAPRVGPPRPQVLPGQAGGGSGGRGGGGRVNQAARRAGRGREWLPDRPDREAAGRRSAPAALVLRPCAPGQVGPLPRLERGGARGRRRPRRGQRGGAGSARAPPGVASPGRPFCPHLGPSRATQSGAVCARGGEGLRAA